LSFYSWWIAVPPHDQAHQTTGIRKKYREKRVKNNIIKVWINNDNKIKVRIHKRNMKEKVYWNTLSYLLIAELFCYTYLLAYYFMNLTYLIY